MSSAYSGRPMSPVESQMDLMKAHVVRAAVRGPKRDTDQHTFRLAMPPSWSEQALCMPAKPSPKRGDFKETDEAVGLKPGEAAARCAGCPVIAECLSAALAEEHGLSAGNRYTIRGGLSPKERAELATANRECDRGHVGRWSDNGKGKLTVCLECKAEDGRARYHSRVVADPDLKARRAESLRKFRQSRRVSCLECKTEMRSDLLERHLSRHESNEEAA